MKKIWRFVFSGGVINTLIFNFKVFPFLTAIRLPVIVGGNVRLLGIHRGCVECPAYTGILRLGIDEGFWGMHRGLGSFIHFGNDGRLVCRGSANVSAVFRINVAGRVEMGDNFRSNTGLLLSCEKEMTFGRDVLLGWNVTMIDGDGHKVLAGGVKVNDARSIRIGNHCWIAANTTILKGVRLMDNTIVPASCCITKPSDTPNCVFANKVLRTNVNWDY